MLRKGSAHKVRKVGLTLGWLFLLAALGCLAFDISLMTEDGNAFALSPLGRIWFTLDVSSLNLTQAIVERYIWPPLWTSGIATILQWPGFFVFLVPGVVLLTLCRRRGPKPKFRKP